jgi:WD40 repeat protein
MEESFRKLEERLQRAGDGAFAALRNAVDEALISANSDVFGDGGVWRRFLMASAHRIARGGARALLQEALAEPEASPVARAAAGWLSAHRPDFRLIRRLDRERRRDPSPCLRIIEAHEGPAQSIALHPTLPLMLSGGADGCVRLWDLETGALEREWRTDGRLVCAIAPADGRRVVVGASPYLEVWDIDDDRRLSQVASGLAYFAFMALHPDGKRVVVANAETALTRALDGSSQVPRADAMPAGVRGVIILPDGDHAASLRGFRTLDTWRLDDGTLAESSTNPAHSRARIEMERAAATAHSVATHGHRAYTISGEPRVRVWDMRRHEQVYALDGHDGPVRALAIDGSGRRLATAADDGTVRLWDAAMSPSAADPSAHQGPVVHASFAIGGERVHSVCSAGLLKQWDVDTTLCLSTQLPFWRVAPDHHLTAAAAGPDAVFLADSRGALKRVDHSGRSGWRFAHTGTPLLAVTADPSGVFVAAAGRAALRFFDAHAGNTLATVKSREAHFEPALAFIDINGPLLAAAAGATVVLYDPASGGFTATLRHGESLITALAAGSDGTLLSGSEDGLVRVFGVARTELQRSFRAHTGRITAMAHAADASLLCTVGVDRCLKVWTPAGHCVARFELDTKPTSCAFGPVGRLSVGDASGRVLLLQLD